MEQIALADAASFVALIAAGGAVAGFLAGVFGIGGGSILVPIFFVVFGWAGVDEAVRMHLSVGTSLAIIVPTSWRSFQRHRSKGAVDMDLLKGFVVTVPLGVLFASLVIAIISGDGLQVVFALIAILVGLRLIFARASWKLGDDIPTGPVRHVTGIVIGFLSTLMGIGGGVLNNTFMTLFGRPIHQAVATSAGVGVLISVPALVGVIWAGWSAQGLPVGSTGYVNWIGVALVIPITLWLAPYGADFAHRLEKRKLEVAFGIFLLIVAARFIQTSLG